MQQALTRLAPLPHGMGREGGQQARQRVERGDRLGERPGAAPLAAIERHGLPVDAIQPQGAIYLSFRVNLPGQTNETIRAKLLDNAGMAVVPFQAFDMKEDSGWFRISIGAVGKDEIPPMLERLARVIRDEASA